MTIRQHRGQSIGKGLRLSALSFAIALTIPSINSINIVHAQTAPDESTVVYPAAFFAQYSPVSANDMVTRIPGVSLSSSSSGRGLGSGGDLLIDGKRLAGKDNSASTQLTRIAADQVERIELIRGSSGTLDVRGAAQVVNVVLKDAGRRSSVSVEVSADRHHDGKYDPGATLSYGGQAGDLSYLFSILADPKYNNTDRTEYSYAPDLSLNEIVTEESTRDQKAYEFSTNLGYEFERDRIQLNALYKDDAHPVYLDRQIATPGVSLPTFERELTDKDIYNWEIGGTHEHTFADNSRFQFLFVVNDETDDSVRERFRLGSNGEDKNLYLESNKRTRERIGQGTYSWRLSDTQDMQLGLERAQTILDTSLFYGTATANGVASPMYGGLVPVRSASNPGSTVEEMRYEGFAVHNWALNDRMTLESTLLYENSTITQTGVVDRSRDFEFIRPKLDYRFDVTDNLQFRALVERRVSQLSFESFTATTNDDDVDKETTAGNPDLSQEKELYYETTLEYRLPDDGGVLTSRFFYRDIDDVIGKVNISSDPNKPVSATGNLGNGQRYGIYLDASTRLSFLGLPDAVLTTSVNLFDSYVYDPILGEDRRFNSRGNTSIGFRHDVTSLGLNYGFTLSSDIDGGQMDVDVDTIERDASEPSLSLYISKVAFNNITFRLESNNTLNSDSCYERLRYNGLSGYGTLREIEDSCTRGSGRKVALKIRTTF